MRDAPQKAYESTVATPSQVCVPRGFLSRSPRLCDEPIGPVRQTIPVWEPGSSPASLAGEGPKHPLAVRGRARARILRDDLIGFHGTGDQSCLKTRTIPYQHRFPKTGLLSMEAWEGWVLGPVSKGDQLR